MKMTNSGGGFDLDPNRKFDFEQSIERVYVEGER